MRIPNNNMGCISKRQLERFAENVFRELGLKGWRMKWSGSTKDSVCIRESKTVFLGKGWIGKYPYEGKAFFLHEVAHIDSWPKDDKHGREWCKSWANLILKFMAGEREKTGGRR